MIKRPKAPCYDEATGTDCPDRHVGCKKTCIKNIVYQHRLQAWYKEQEQITQKNNDYYATRGKCYKLYLKHERDKPK